MILKLVAIIGHCKNYPTFPKVWSPCQRHFSLWGPQTLRFFPASNISAAMSPSVHRERFTKCSGMLLTMNKLHLYITLKAVFVHSLHPLVYDDVNCFVRTVAGVAERKCPCQVPLPPSKENQIRIMNDTPGPLRFPGGANDRPQGLSTRPPLWHQQGCIS